MSDDRLDEGAGETQEVSEPRSVFAHKGKLLIALFLVVGALSYFGFIAFQSAIVYYVTVGELNQRGPTEEGELLRVGGKLIAESYYREENSVVARFTLTDGDETVPVVYSGVVPDIFFNEHSEIILEGSYNPDRVFNAETIIVKCPSKYVSASEKADAESF